MTHNAHHTRPERWPTFEEVDEVLSAYTRDIREPARMMETMTDAEVRERVKRERAVRA